jgi:geranylgeranyl diphosphate synthase type II
VWDGLRDSIEQALNETIQATDDCPDLLLESMRYSLEAGGKRLRPILVLLAAEAVGGEQSAAMPAACAIEMIHTYSLIHDDLPAMDNDDFRRGRPTNHKQFDEATAILAGDALLTLAFETLANEIKPPEIAIACVADLASAAGKDGMVGGQMADLLGEKSQDCSKMESIDQLEAIHRRKTGRLLRSALTMGGRIGGGGPDSVEILDEFGKCVGLAFQIADDVLDIIGDPTKMGKGVQKDAQHGKLTYPGLLGLEESRRRAGQLIDDACRAIAKFGDRGQRLEALARFVLERDH